MEPRYVKIRLLPYRRTEYDRLLLQVLNCPNARPPIRLDFPFMVPNEGLSAVQCLQQVKFIAFRYHNTCRCFCVFHKAALSE